jgi:hypothetical protein
VLIVGQASVGGSLGSRAGAKAVAALGAGVQAGAVEGVRGDGGGGCPRWRWIWWVSERWEREREMVGYERALGLSPHTSVGPSPADGSFLNYCWLPWPIEVIAITSVSLTPTDGS